MSYEVLARKWRPHRFDELVGQEHVVQALSNALDNNRLHHAYLFTGTRGVGKTTLARIFAKSLNCEEGVSSHPCGKCSICREVDAASRTKVDQTRELLENVPYAPVRGRYKVYLIDEVHMFSDSSFNALLKTLEEPPEHVKFLLATTDPQKLPMTVLSRCLQFSLKRMTLEQIGGQLRHILESESIPFDDNALLALAAAADGSMRDGLSLLDQAIAFGGGEVRQQQVEAMLGSVSRDYVFGLLDALATGDGELLLRRIADIAGRAPDFSGVLDEMLRVLHNIALTQIIGTTGEETPESGRIDAFADTLPAEDVQLYYQIGLAGKQEMNHAPDLRSGFEMVLLRMLAFRPETETRSGSAAPAARDQGGPPAGASRAPQSSATRSGPAARDQGRAPAADAPAPPAPATQAPPGETGADWSALIEDLDLGGISRQLADNCALESFTENRIRLLLSEQHQALKSELSERRLREALQKKYGEGLTLEIRVGEVRAETPAQQTTRAQNERIEEARQQMADDPFVKAAQQHFDAVMLEESVKPVTR
ncbi:MAG: DNA polymerase III subunit gamma/tau, partial [Gammaproteobacteria bacterium]